MTGWQAFFGSLSLIGTTGGIKMQEKYLSLEEAIKIWNTICGPYLGRVRVANEKRRRAFKRRQEEIEEYRTKEGFEHICHLVISSPFLRGELNNEDHWGWKAHFDFILQPTSAARLVEGFYHRKPKRKSSRYPVYTTLSPEPELSNNTVLPNQVAAIVSQLEDIYGAQGLTSQNR